MLQIKYRDVIFFDGEDREDLGRGESGWLSNVSDEVVYDKWTMGFMM